MIRSIGTFLEKKLKTLLAFFIASPKVALVFLGLISALGFAPVNGHLFALAPGLVYLLYLANRSTFKQALLYGWIFGFFHFLGGLYWIAYSLTVDFQSFFWLVPFVLFLIPGILALCPALVTAFTTYWRGASYFYRAFVFSLLWVLFEGIRGYFLGGFPWNLAGYVWSFSHAAWQVLHIVGIYGLSFLTVLIATLLGSRRTLLMAACLFSGISFYGAYRLSGYDAARQAVYPGITLRLVQPNIEQKLKWSMDHRRKILDKLMALSHDVGNPFPSPITHVIWPESAAVFDVIYDERTLDSIVPPHGTTLLFGAPHILRNAAGKMQTLWNGFFTLNAHGHLAHLYDKVHLTPYGEYIPFRSWLPHFMQKITPGTLDYSPGNCIKTVVLQDLPPFRPLICYESIFPQEVMPSAPPKPQWILNITNDAWFGVSSGPHQHLVMMRARAIETGLAVMRVANTGISAVIDPYGRVLQSLDLNTAGTIDTPLIKPLETPFYIRYTQKVFWWIIMVVMALVTLIRALQRKSSNNE